MDYLPPRPVATGVYVDKTTMIGGLVVMPHSTYKI